MTEHSPELAATRRKRLLPWPLAAGLGVTVLIQTAAACWVLAPASAWVPYAGSFNLMSLPHMLVWSALLAVALLAPMMIAGQTSDESFNVQALFAAVWQGVVTGFTLLVAARLTPLSAEAIIWSGVWAALCAWLCFLLARVLPRAYAAVMFLWLIAVPVLGYLLAELFLSSPAGSAGWQRAAGAQADTLRSAVHWMLSFSPVTAVMGTLKGTLPDGSAGPGPLPPAVFAVLAVVLMLIARRRRREPQMNADERR